MPEKINIILTDKFPYKRAICVLTRVDFNYLINTGYSLAWDASLTNAKKQTQIVMVGLDDNQRGKLLIGNILDVKTVADIKTLENRGAKISEKLQKFLNSEKKISVSPFYNPKFNPSTNPHTIRPEDKRLVIEFDDKTYDVDELDVDYTGLSNPVFYIPKR